MAQHDYIISNQSGAAFRSDLNNGLAAIVSQNSGAAQPSTTYAYQWWADTTTGLLKLRNAANNAWITTGILANANLGLLPTTGGTITGDLTLNAQSDLRLADADSSNWVALQAPVTVASNITLTVPSTVGTADQTLVTDGTGVLSFAARSRLVRTTVVTTTGGTSIDFTSIPSWVRRITVMLDGVSTNGTSVVLIRVGSGSTQSTGYNSITSSISSGGATVVTSTSGFIVIGSTATASRLGSLILTQLSGNTWVAQGGFYDASSGSLGNIAGNVAVSGALDRVSVTTTNGTDTFDTVSVNIIYED